MSEMSAFDDPAPTEIRQPNRPNVTDVLGPGLITGASDDDPSGIATYSQAGARFGYGLIWTLVITYPLMCAIQMVSAQIGRVTAKDSPATCAGTIPYRYSMVW
jgi:Mn2+/Fe2+ NRAMP family transporter